MEQAYDAWQTALLEFKDLESRKRERLQRQDLLAFQCREIEEASLTAGEDEHLELEKNRLRSSEQLHDLGGGSYRMLEDSVVPALQQCRKELERMAELDATVSPLAERIAGAGYELEDCLAVLRNYMEELPSNPQQLEIVAERIHQINLLKKKYGPAIEDILAFGKKAADELAGLGHLEEDLEKLEKSCLNLEGDAVAKGRELSAKRKEVAVKLEKNLMRELASLSLENAVFSVVFPHHRNEGSASLRRQGFDVPEFYFSANPGEPAKPLARVASGGELSRLMLALRCILARQDKVETVIFDEIDAGVSGKAAERVGLKIKELAAHHQVLCITHLPQIASRADAHYRVDKKIADQRTKTSISRLSEEERAGELARMLDGTFISEKTLDYARELLARNKAQNSAGQIS